MEQTLLPHFDICLLFFVSVGAFPKVTQGHLLKNDLQARISKQSVTLSKQNVVKYMFI